MAHDIAAIGNALVDTQFMVKHTKKILDEVINKVKVIYGT